MEINESDFKIEVNHSKSYPQYACVTIYHETSGYYGCDSEADLSLDNVKLLHKELTEFLNQQRKIDE